MKPDKPCPVCGDQMSSHQMDNPISRVMPGAHICNQCGNREALLDMREATRAKDRRLCLYADEASGIMLIIEDEPGYEPFGRKPPDPAWADAYCAAWNTAIGLSASDMTDIMASSMFGRWANFGAEPKFR